MIKRPLLESYIDMPDPNIEQIHLDLNRTFIDSCFEEDDIHAQMLRILHAYTKRNPQVGYCQGMNNIVLMILKVVNDEEAAFWLFCMIIECVLPLDYYSMMIQVLIDQKVLMHLLSTKNPKFLQKYSDLEVELIMKSFQWFICLY